jgi:hypothetical protein
MRLDISMMMSGDKGKFIKTIYSDKSHGKLTVENILLISCFVTISIALVYIFLFLINPFKNGSSDLFTLDIIMYFLAWFPVIMICIYTCSIISKTLTYEPIKLYSNGIRIIETYFERKIIKKKSFIHFDKIKSIEIKGIQHDNKNKPSLIFEIKSKNINLFQTIDDESDFDLIEYYFKKYNQKRKHNIN